MSAKENKEWMQQFYKDWLESAGDVAKRKSFRDKYYAPDAVFHSLSGGDMKRDQYEQQGKELSSAFQINSLSVNDMVAEDEKVAVRWTLQETHVGMFRGVPGTGKQIIVKGVEIYRIRQGKILDVWIFSDSLGRLTQLGAIPSAGTTK